MGRTPSMVALAVAAAAVASCSSKPHVRQVEHGLGAPQGAQCGAAAEQVEQAAVLRANGYLGHALATLETAARGCPDRPTRRALADTLAELWLNARAIEVYRELEGDAAPDERASLQAIIAELQDAPPHEREFTEDEKRVADLAYTAGQIFRNRDAVYDRSLAEFAKAYALRPHPLTIVQMGLTYKAMGDEVEARKHNARALAVAEEIRGARATPLIQVGQSSMVNAVAFSYDSRMLASASSDEKVRLWSVIGGNELQTLEHASEVQSVAMSPDGRVATGTSNGVISIWTAATGKHQRDLAWNGVVEALAFDRDGSHLAAISKDGTLAVWDPRLGTELWSAPAHANGGGWSVAFSPDGLTLASGGQDGVIRLWSVASGAERIKIPDLGEPIYAVAFTHDNKRIAAASRDGQVHLWDVDTAEEGLTIRVNSPVTSIAFHPTRPLMVSGDETGWVKLWDVSQAPRERWSGLAHSGAVRGVAFSRDGIWMASGSDDNTMRLWQVAPEEHEPVEVNEVAADDSHATDATPTPPERPARGDNPRPPRGDRDARPTRGGTDRPDTGGSQPETEGENGPDDLDVVPADGDPEVEGSEPARGDGQTPPPHGQDGHPPAHGEGGPPDHAPPQPGAEATTASGTQGQTDTGAAAADKRPKKAPLTVYKTFGQPDSLSVAFSPDGKRLASGSGDQTVKLWNIEAGTDVWTLRGHQLAVRAVAFSPDGKTIASGSHDAYVKLWDTATGRERQTWMEHSYSMVKSVAFSPNGLLLASGSMDRSVRVWNVESASLQTQLGYYDPYYNSDPYYQDPYASGHTAGVRCVAFDPDGKLLASGSEDNTIILWDVSSSYKTGTFTNHTGWVHTVAFSPDGTILASGSADDTARLWDVVNQRELRTLSGHQDDVTSVAFSPDGKLLATGAMDNTIKLWDVATGDEVRTLSGHTAWVRSVAFRPDSSQIATGSSDGTVKLWNYKTGELLATLFAKPSGLWLVVEGDRVDGSPGEGGGDSLLIWRVGDDIALPGYVGWQRQHVPRLLTQSISSR